MKNQGGWKMGEHQKKTTSRSRKVVGIGVVSTLGLPALLAGCGGGSNGTATNGSGGSGSNNGVVQLTLWHAMGGATGQALDQIINDFNASQNKIKVTPVY